MITEYPSQFQNLINSITAIGDTSQDVYWLSTADFETILYVSPAYEKIWCRSRENLIQNPPIWISHLLSKDVKEYHPIEEMAKRIEKLGQNACYNETYRVVQPNGEARQLIDRGHPIANESGRCIAVTGVAVDITSIPVFSKKYHFPEIFPEQKLARYYLNKKFSHIYLTKREAECAYYILQGKSIKQIGSILKLSYRTVETYIKYIAQKLNTFRKGDTIDALLKNGFLDNF